METYVNGIKITPEEREKIYLENLNNPEPGVDYLWHKYTMPEGELERIHGKRQLVWYS